MKQLTQTSAQLDGLPWEQFIDYLKTNMKDLNIDNFNNNLEIYQFAANPNNMKSMTESALKSLKKTNSKTATSQKAKGLAEMMHLFAKYVIREAESRKENRGEIKK